MANITGKRKIKLFTPFLFMVAQIQYAIFQGLQTYISFPLLISDFSTLIILVGTILLFVIR